MRTLEAAADIATSMGLTQEEMLQQAMVTFLIEKKRRLMQDRLEIMARYGVSSLEELEERIASGDVAEHPTWEDLIVAENLTAKVAELDRYLQRLR
ncbi:MAG: hypothetical protein E3J21_04620 [Anaerolineales bacterium]|nr:MAG: hypothetical protein E3J21_04620 [Anaerolineales bacterium]